MRLSEWISANTRYLRHVLTKNPPSGVHSQGMRADLHAHPFVTGPKSLLDTLDVLRSNRLSLLAHTVHGAGSNKEMDFWKVKDLLKRIANRACQLEDLGILIQVWGGGYPLVITSGYELYCRVEGLRGRLNLTLVAGNEGLARHLKPNMGLNEIIRIGRDHGAIILASHPYTLWDPYGFRSLFKFRLPDRQEREIIREQVFTQVDGVDLVATNVAWMIRSNELVEKEYPGKPLCTSDTHAVTRRLRREIGRSGSFFSHMVLENAERLRETLKSRIRSGNFETYLRYLSPWKFLRSIVLVRPSKEYP